MRLIRATFLYGAMSMMAAVGVPQDRPTGQATGAPTITVQPTNATVTLGARATFSVTATGTAPLKYQWYEYGGPIQGANAAKYTTPAVTNQDNGVDYYVVVSNSLGTATSNYVYVNVNDPPTIVGQPASVTVSLPSFVFFSVDAAGTGTLTYQWYKNGVAVPTANGPTCPTGPLTAADNGDKYFVVVKNAYGAATSKPATITVNSSSTSTLPMVGYWSGTATVTDSIEGTSTTQVQVAIGATSYAITATVAFTDDDGSPDFASGLSSFNGQNISTVSPGGYDDASSMNIAGGFSSNLLKLSGIAAALDASSNSGGNLAVSPDGKTLTGTSTYSFAADGGYSPMNVGTVAWNLAREN